MRRNALRKRNVANRLFAMKCYDCDAELTVDAVYCHRCGTRVAETAPIDAPLQRFQAAADKIRDEDDEPERELWHGRFSKLAMIGSWIAAAVATLVMLVVAMAAGFSSTGWTAALAGLLLLWAGLAARLLYRQLSEHYFLTNQRFVHEKGLLWREIDRIEAIDIDDVSFQQGPVGRFLGVGTISVRSSDQTHPVMELLGIENVREVAGMIDEVRRQERRKRGLHIEAV